LDPILGAAFSDWCAPAHPRLMCNGETLRLRHLRLESKSLFARLPF